MCFASQLWVRTCQLNPDVVALHGGLSVNILRLMLDLKDNATSSTRRQSTLFREPSIRTKRPLLYTDPSVHSSGHTRNTRGYAQSTRGIDSSLHSASSNRGVRSMRLLGSSSHAQKGRDKRSLGTIDVKDEYMRYRKTDAGMSSSSIFILLDCNLSCQGNQWCVDWT